MKTVRSQWLLVALTGALAAGSAAHAQYNTPPANPQPATNTQSTTKSQDYTNTTMESDQPGTDTWITTKVKSELAVTEGVKSLDISVKTVNGVVMLSGLQANDAAVQKAVIATRSVKGVKEVDASLLRVKQ